MREEDLEVAIKVVIVGNGAVGKSSMIQRFCKGTFTFENQDYFFIICRVSPGEPVRLMLWDTAGQEEFDALTKAYYRGAHACLLVFSATDRLSFMAMPSWKHKRQLMKRQPMRECMREVEEECGQIPMALVQNKIDMAEQCMILDAKTSTVYEEASQLAQALGCPLFRTSVREGIGVLAPFMFLSKKCVMSLRVDSYFQESKGVLGEDLQCETHGAVWNVGVPKGGLGPHGRQSVTRGTVVLRKGNGATSRRGTSGLSRKLGGVLDSTCQLL
ncbi:hypothetical protein J437_LFUL012404 [Ladona fulva]|uniref:Uncharacterized protein n=1 Tax=Ladona fulva TaxID=123851 RepID=A0A8K0P6B8_LADFU|nr:hypothetical protein J437_LFUL012404 [Ladona fulva]